MDHFFPLLPPSNPENQNFERWKNARIYHYFTQAHHKLTPKIKIWDNFKKAGDITLLHTCTINKDHLMYDSWDMQHDRQNFFVIVGYFLHFYLSNSPKKLKWIKTKKNKKKTPRDIYQKYVENGCNSCSSLWRIFCPFTLQQSKKWKFQKNEKKKKKKKP